MQIAPVLGVVSDGNSCPFLGFMQVTSLSGEISQRVSYIRVCMVPLWYSF